ncbi:hypothetical protein Bca4012_036430 [Brassica carinata]
MDFLLKNDSLTKNHHKSLAHCSFYFKPQDSKTKHKKHFPRRIASEAFQRVKNCLEVYWESSDEYGA